MRRDGAGTHGCEGTQLVPGGLQPAPKPEHSPLSDLQLPPHPMGCVSIRLSWGRAGPCDVNALPSHPCPRNTWEGAWETQRLYEGFLGRMWLSQC